MGVRGLWRLLLPIGRRISIETLEGKILAIDASIWLTQFLKAMRDPDTGSVRPAAHLIGFFRRLSKLRYHGIRPVLVFDGATPEIKKREIQFRRQRREQIFHNHEYNTVQRMAKRLLVAELKKKKEGSTNVAPTAIAPGFNLAQEEEQQATETTPHNNEGASTDRQVTVTEEEKVNTNEERETENKTNQETTVNMSENVIDLADELEVPVQDDSDNDWGAEEQDSDSEFEPENDSDGNINDDNKGDNVFDIEHVAALPSHERKDAIEDARRRQRMKSRREFMPVAAQPAEYSQVQLRNFLRSSRLNQQIQNMAVQTASGSNNQDELGERVASDATRRIIFTKDKEEPPQNNTSRLKRRSIIRNNQSVDNRTGEASSDEEEFEWQDEDAVSTPLDKEPPVSNKAIPDFEDDSSEEYGGGFLVESPSSARKGEPETEQTESDIEGGGGFLVETTAEESQTGNSLQNKGAVDDRHEQELNDEVLARAIQESELEESDIVAVEDGALAAEVDTDAALAAQLQAEEDATQDSHFTYKDDARAAETIGLQTDSDESEDHVEWEDCDDGTDAQEVPLPTPNSQNNEDSTLTTQWKIENGKAAAAVRKTNEEISLLFSGATLRPKLREVQALEDEEDETQYLFEDTGQSDRERNDFARPVATDATVAALEHAQATASNLTDWAGRAFRRAIAKHVEETGATMKGFQHDSPQPSVTDDKPAETPADQSTTPKDGVVSFSDQHTDQQEVDMARVNLASVSQEDTTSLRHDESRKGQNDLTNVDPLAGHLASLQEEQLTLNEELNRQERDMDTISDEMKEEVIMLIQLFGIPYVEAPAEAEAQCAALEDMGLVDGIVTEDSDVFVFGGKSVYKNIFDDQKYVEAYLASDSKKDLALGRNEFVALAMLLGGDYTEGVKGVGIVNGMEVLQAFDVSKDVKHGLSKFRHWLDGFDGEEAVRGASSGMSAQEKVFHEKHRTARIRWTAPKEFPASNVLNAYTNPVVDKSRETFSWGVPDVQNLKLFCQRNMGWDAKETERLITPVVEKVESGSRQTRIESFFMKYEDDIKFAKVNSKRLRDVFRGIQNSRNETGHDAVSGNEIDHSSPTESGAKRKKQKHTVS